MAAPEEGGKPQIDEEKFCEIEGTVVTGFETIAKDEAAEKLGVVSKADRGKITFSIRVKDVHKILELQSIDNLSVIVSRYDNLQFADTLVGALDQFACMVPRADWVLGLNIWSRFWGFSQPVSPLPGSSWSQYSDDVMELERKYFPKENWTQSGITNTGTDTCTRTEKPTGDDHGIAGTNCHEDGLPVNNDDANSDIELVAKLKSTNLLSDKVSEVESESPDDRTSPDEDKSINKTLEEKQISENKEGDAKKKIQDPNMPCFRATCYRSGGKHIFQSPEAAIRFGGTVQDYFGWNVNLKNFDLEVVLTIEGNHVYIGICLTKESRHKRHVVAFGPTTLRPTIAYNMLRLCQIKPGDVVCDPMCGGGTIPIEAAVNWPSSTHLCGDYHELAVPRTAENVTAVNQKRIDSDRKPINLDIIRWNTCQLPLKNNYVDVFCTDLPFGKRSGSKMRNWQLYPLALKEMARVCKPNTGRACLLTQDRKCLTKTLQALTGLWRRGRTLWVNIGGLGAGVFLLHRTDKAMDSAATTMDSSATATATSMTSTTSKTKKKKVPTATLR